VAAPWRDGWRICCVVLGSLACRVMLLGLLALLVRGTLAREPLLPPRHQRLDMVEKARIGDRLPVGIHGVDLGTHISAHHATGGDRRDVALGFVDAFGLI